MNEFVKIRDDADKEVLKKLKKLLKKYKVKQDAVNEHIAAIIIENLNDEGLIILSPEMQFALQNSVSVELQELAIEEQEFLKKLMDDCYTSAAVKTASVLGLKGSYDLVRQEMIDRAINTIIDGKNFSSRVWDNTNDLANRIYNDVLECVRTGKRPNAIAKKIKDDFGSSAYQAKRLVQTELARVVSDAQIDIYKTSGVVKKVMWTATLESNTCDYCADLDGKYFNLDDAPKIPAHPNCRCCYVPVVDGWKAKTRADNETKTEVNYQTFEEWRNSKKTK
ncbi:MAG: minor capsid protein [Clostridia bacterium]|nr:minor capsid protein [Clostridia bacterium]